MEIKTNYISKFFFSKNDTVPVGHMVDELMGICCSFRLDKAEWVNNLEGEKTYEDLEFINDTLKDKDSEFPEITKYELARRIWNINHDEDLQIPKMKMPDYLNMR